MIGPCCFCGHPFADHRQWDGLLGMISGGEPPILAIAAYDLDSDELRHLANEAAESDEIENACKLLELAELLEKTG